MFVTTRAYYAVRALVHLAQNEGEGVIPLRAIAEREGISKDFLEQLMMRLKRAGIVAATKGPGGGYRLGKAPADIDIMSVLTAAGEEISMSPCACVSADGPGDNGMAACSCDRGSACPSSRLWIDAASLLRGYFERKSLADLLDQG